MVENNKAIYFFRTNNDFGYLSNFYTCNFRINDITFCCMEQWIMYNKCLLFDPNSILIDKILNENNPSKIKAYGRLVKNYVDNIWSEKRYEVLIKGLYAKFEQNLEIRNKLLSTSNKILYEASPYDRIWGIGLSARDALITDSSLYGKNILGVALMETRNKFR